MRVVFALMDRVAGDALAVSHVVSALPICAAPHLRVHGFSAATRRTLRHPDV